MACCNISGCKTVGKSIDFLPGNHVLCDKHCIDLFKLFVEECDDGQVNSDSVSSALAKIIKMESKPIKSILPKLEKDDDEDLFFGTGMKR